MRSIRPRRFQSGGLNPATVGASMVPSITPAATSGSSPSNLAAQLAAQAGTAGTTGAGTTGGSKIPDLAARLAPAAPGTYGTTGTTGPGGWQALLATPGLKDQNPQLYSMLQMRQSNPQLFQQNASSYSPFAQAFLGLGSGSSGGTSGTSSSGSQQQSPAQTGSNAAQSASPQATQSSDQQLAVQSADRLRAAAAALGTGPTPVGAAAAQAAQNALAGKTGTIGMTQSPLTGVFAHGGKVRRFQSGGKADDDDSKPDPNAPDDRAEEFTSAQRKALGPYPDFVNVAGVSVPGASGTWDPNFLGKGEGEYLPKPDSFLPQQLDEYQEFLNRNQGTLRDYREARDKQLMDPEARTPAGIRWKDLPPYVQSLRPPRGLPFEETNPGSYILLKDLLAQDPNYKLPPSRPLLGYRVNPQSREYEVPQPRSLGLEYRAKAKGGSVRPKKFQAGGSNDPTGGAYLSWTPAQQQAWGNGASVDQVNAMSPATTVQSGVATTPVVPVNPNSLTPAQVAANILSSSATPPYPTTGGPFSYDPMKPPSQNPAAPAGYTAVPFGTGTGAGGTSMVPTAATYAQMFQQMNANDTPAYVQNEYAVGNAGSPMIGTTVNINGQSVPWNSMTPEQQYVYGALSATGQKIPDNFMATYQGPSTFWNDPSLNTIGVPSGSSIVNGALVNSSGNFVYPGSSAGTSAGPSAAVSRSPNVTTSPGGIGTSPGTFTSNATGAGVGQGSGATGTTTAATATPAVTQSPTGSAGSGSGLGFRKGGKMAQHRPRRFQVGGYNADPTGGSNWQQALQQMLQGQQVTNPQLQQQGAGALQGLQGMSPMGGGMPGMGGPQGMGGAQGMGAAAGAMPPGPGAAAMGAMAGAMPGMGQMRTPQSGQGAAAAGMGAMAGAMPGSPGAAAMGALAGASQGAPGGGGMQNQAALMQALGQRFQGGLPGAIQGQQGGMGGAFGPAGATAPGAGAGPGSSYGAAATPNQQWGQMLLGGAPGTGLMNQGAMNPMGQQALWRNYLGQLAGGLGMTGQGMGMARGGSVPPEPDEHGDVGSHYRVPLRGGEHEKSSHPDQQWGMIADGERRYQTGGMVDESPKTHATGVPMSRRKATGGSVDTAPKTHASGVPIKGSPKGGQPLGTVSKFNSAKGAPGNLATKAAGRGRGFAKGGVTGSKGTLDSTKPAPGNLATSQAGKDRFAEGGVLAFAAGGAHEAVRPKTSKTVLRRRPAPMPHSPRRARPVPTPPYRDQDNQDAMDMSAPVSAPAPAAAPPGPPPSGPPPFAKGGKVCASCGKAHGGACKGMARGGKFAGAQQRAIRRAGGGKWIQGAIKKPGALRAQLGVKGGETIPAGKLAKAAKAPGKLGQRARLAQTLKGFKHARGGAASCPDCGKQHSGSCKMAAGGVAKVRRGFPNTIKAPKRLARGGTVRGGGVAKRGLKFSGVF